jgi:transcriptional regulator with GAF, ATPase, and Fis domain
MHDAGKRVVVVDSIHGSRARSTRAWVGVLMAGSKGAIGRGYHFVARVIHPMDPRDDAPTVAKECEPISHRVHHQM